MDKEALFDKINKCLSSKDTQTLVSFFGGGGGEI